MTAWSLCLASLLLATQTHAGGGGGGKKDDKKPPPPPPKSKDDGGKDDKNDVDVVYSGSMTANVGLGMQSVSVTLCDENVQFTMTGYMPGGWFGFGFGSGKMEGSYSIVAALSPWSVREYVLREKPLSGDQSENEVWCGLSVESDSNDGLIRTVVASRPRVCDAYTFPYDESGAYAIGIDMITAKSNVYGDLLAYHGDSNRAGMCHMRQLSDCGREHDLCVVCSARIYRTGAAREEGGRG